MSRTSATAIRTGTTGATSTTREPSANGSEADLSFEEFVAGYFDARRNKRNTRSALAFEANLEPNLVDLYERVVSGSWQPGRSICFVVMWPKPREIFAAPFPDRVVHRVFYNRIAPRFERRFIADSCACIKGRGTLYATKRLERKIRSLTQNWSRPGFYLKCDLSNFFVTINKPLVGKLLAEQITEPWWLELAERILFHDPRTDAEVQSPPEKLALIPPHKSLWNQPSHLGLPIGNLPSQFFANVLMNKADQHVKHDLRARHYIRYVDDIVLLDESREWLNYAKADLETFLPQQLAVTLNPRKTVVQPLKRGVDFVGRVIKPWRTTVRRRTVNSALRRIASMPRADVYEPANSYFGLFGQASHSHGDRAALASLLMQHHGMTVNRDLTQTYRRSS